MHRFRLTAPCLAAALLSLIAAGCAQVVAGDAEGVSVDVGYVGEIAPGTRSWFSWLQANEHCAALGRKPRLVDLRGSVAIYRCVPEE